jgi:hypothetical protein
MLRHGRLFLLMIELTVLLSALDPTWALWPMWSTTSHNFRSSISEMTGHQDKETTNVTPSKPRQTDTPSPPPPGPIHFRQSRTFKHHVLRCYSLYHHPRCCVQLLFCYANKIHSDCVSPPPTPPLPQCIWACSVHWPARWWIDLTCLPQLLYQGLSKPWFASHIRLPEEQI